MIGFLQKLHPTFASRSGALGLTVAFLLSSWVLKPTPISNAGIPEVLAGGELKETQATAIARNGQRQEQLRQVRADNYDLGRFPISDANEKHWRYLLWTTAVVEPQEPFVADALDQILAMMTQSGLSNSQMRTIDAATKVGTQLYLSNPSLYAVVGKRFLQAIDQSPDEEWVAVSLSALAKAGTPIETLQRLAEQVKGRLPGWAKNVPLQATLQEIAEAKALSTHPPLKDLLNWTITPKQLHLYVLCQPDRYVLCQAILKDRNGEFVRSDGKLWSVPLLLRSIYNLNWNFVRGQTPQGVYRMEGMVPKADDHFFRAYGQFPLVNLFVPFEEGAKQFLPNTAGAFTGSLETYQSLLPPSWRNYFPVQQSFWAGKAGRSAFRIHGTGDSPDFFSGKDRNPDSYNWNPTIGCLSALELYNEQGQLVQADMPRILRALEQGGGRNFAGYLIVVELPGQPGQPIDLRQIESAIARNPTRPTPQAQSQPTPQAKAEPKSQPQKVAAAPAPPAPVAPVRLSSRVPSAAPVAPAPSPPVSSTAPLPDPSPSVSRLPIAY